MTEEIRYGIIGAGIMGIEHVQNVNNLDGAVVAAIADPIDGMRAWGAAEASGEVELFEDHRDLLASGLVDAVVVATPNMTHADVMEDVLAVDGLHVMVEKGREPLLDNVAREFAHYKDLAEGKVHLHVRSARALDEDQKNEIVSLVAQRSGKTVQLHEHIEPELIGGTIVRLDDFVIDGTLKRKLKALRKALLEKERLFE